MAKLQPVKYELDNYVNFLYTAYGRKYNFAII